MVLLLTPPLQPPPELDFGFNRESQRVLLLELELPLLMLVPQAWAYLAPNTLGTKVWKDGNGARAFMVKKRCKQVEFNKATLSFCWTPQQSFEDKHALSSAW
jgi:hypothetical protein